MTSSLDNILSQGDVLVLDWGIGGIGTYQVLRQRHPDLDIVYWSDAGQTPYGKMTERDLQERLQFILQCAARAKMSFAFVACNAASTALPSFDAPLPTTGVIAPAVRQLCAISPGHVGIIGGVRTIESNAYGEPLAAAGLTVTQNIAQPLSALIESGAHTHESSRPVIAQILKGLEDVDTLVLACTHYVAASAVIAEVLPHPILFDPVDYCVAEAEAMVRLPQGRGRATFLTTGSVEQMRQSARLAFDEHIDHITHMTL